MKVSVTVGVHGGHASKKRCLLYLKGEDKFSPKYMKIKSKHDAASAARKHAYDISFINACSHTGEPRPPAEIRRELTLL